MKAAVTRGFGEADQIAIVEVDRPHAEPGQVCVRVQLSTVTMGDTELRSMRLPWIFRIPLRLMLRATRSVEGSPMGMQLAGTVDEVGEGVTGFAVGDAVVAAAGMSFGAQAEYVCVAADEMICRVPDGVALEDVVSLPVEGGAARAYLRKGQLDRAKTVLVRGASGSIGTYAVQLARRAGAQVTGVCGTEALSRVHELGAEAVIDYTEKDWTASDARYDLILDVVGQMPISRCAAMLSAGGSYVRCTVPGFWELCVALWWRLTRSERVVLGDAGETVEDLAALVDLVESGELRSVVDRRYPLAEIADAHRYVETGHKQGHVLIDVAGPE